MAAGTSKWSGAIDELCISARALSEGFLKTQRLNYLSPRDFYGVGAVNSASVTNLSPILPPIFATATTGTPSIVDAALQAYEGDTGQVKTLESLTGSGGGTSSIVSGRAQFLGSSAGTWRRTATVEDSAIPAKRSLAPIVWVTSAAPPPSGRFKVAPTLGQIRNATTSNIANVYAACNSGDQLVLAAGNYGAFNFNRTFNTANPLIVRAASGSPWTAIFTGTVTLSGAGHWLYELKTQQPNTSSAQIGISLKEPFQIITRCWINNANGIMTPTDNTTGWTKPMHDVWVGWNRFTGQNTLAARRDQIYLALPDDGVWTTNTKGPYKIYIYRNFFWDDKSIHDEDHSVYFGDSKSGDNDIPMMWETYVEENFWHANCLRKRILYLKRGPHVLYNHAQCFRGNFGIRHGTASRWYGNRSNCSGMDFSGHRQRSPDRNYDQTRGDPWPTAVDGHHHDLRGNIFNGPIRLLAGATVSATDDTPPYQAAHFAVLVANTVTDGCDVGFVYGAVPYINELEGGKVEGVKIYKAGKTMAVAIKSGCRDTPTVSDGDGGYDYPGKPGSAMRATANYPLDGFEQGVETHTQASAT